MTSLQEVTLPQWCFQSGWIQMLIFFYFVLWIHGMAHITYENALAALFIQGLIFLLISGAGFTSISSHAR